MLFRRNRRADGADSAAALEDEPEPASGTDQQLNAIASLSSALVRAKDKHAVARVLIDTCFSLLDVDLAAVALVSEDAKSAEGLLAVSAEGGRSWSTTSRARSR
jgi:DNA replicative helicase MCM subunit Mcm2 (Cdc46/Mcm family)